MKYLLLLSLLFGGLEHSKNEVPNFRLKNLDGRTVSYNQVKGENLTVIDFWATWCKPCVKSIPEFVKMDDEFDDTQVQFIGISIDGPRNKAKVKPFIKSLGVEYPVLRDSDSSLMGRLGVRAVPSLLIVNSDNEIIYFHEGYKSGEEIEIKKKILELLEE
ncbi:MAG: TlpA disulfide reductase family protein [Balneola sp.]|jgi:cytochrome c biogenesis protein CcmG/thiol:disulfide interchange protein DsbE